MKTLFFYFTEDSTIDNQQVDESRGYTELSFHGQPMRAPEGTRQIDPEALRKNTFDKLRNPQAKPPGKKSPFRLNPFAPNLIDPFFGRIIN